MKKENCFGESSIIGDPKKNIKLELRNSSVSTEKLKDKAVSTDKLADNSVTNSKMLNSSVTNSKLADNTITSTKLEPGLRSTIISTYDKTIELDNQKANIADVGNAIERLENKIGERFIVEGDVTNLPDEEDLTSVSTIDGREVMKLNDRAYEPSNFSGKGYKILRKNIKKFDIPTVSIVVSYAPTSSGDITITVNDKVTTINLDSTTDTTPAIVATKIAAALKSSLDDYDVSVSSNRITLTRHNDSSVSPSSINVGNTSAVITITDDVNKNVRKNILTDDMIGKPNTIYEIKYDFDLCSANLVIPEGCKLKFSSGSISNGQLTGDNTMVIADKYTIFYNVNIAGTWITKDIYSIWFNLISNNTNVDNKTNLQNIVNLTSDNITNNIYIEDGTFYSTKTGGLLNLTSNTNVYFSNASINILDNDDIRESIIQIKNRDNVSLYNVKLVGDFKTHKFSSGKSDEWNHGIKVGGSSNVNIINCNVSYCVGDGIDIIDSYEGNSVCKNITVRNCVLDNNGRQGISIESGDNVTIEYCSITNTSKIKLVSPGAAIDIEPWRDTILKNIHISHCEMYDNNRSISIYLDFLSDPNKNRNILIEECFLNTGAILASAYFVTFRNIKYVSKGNEDHRVLAFRNVQNCVFDNTPAILANTQTSPFVNNKIINCQFGRKEAQGEDIASEDACWFGSVSNITIQNCVIHYWMTQLRGSNYISNSVISHACDTVIEDENNPFIFLVENSIIKAQAFRGRVDFRNCILNVGNYYFKSMYNCKLVFNTTSSLIWKGDAEIMNCLIDNGPNTLRLDNKSDNKTGVLTITNSIFKNDNLSKKVTVENIVIDKGFYGIKNVATDLKKGTIFIDNDKTYIKTTNKKLLIPCVLNDTTANRPTLGTNEDLGFQYYDTTLKKYIVWNGTEWTNMDGTAL